jgi:probable rRNA maturation factor
MTRRGRAVVVTVQNAARGAAVPPRRELERWTRSALEDGVRGEITVRIVAESESAELNSRYRGKRGPTNVLSFPAEAAAADRPAAPAGEVLPFGDLVICADVVAREAREQGKEPAAHWAHMVVHGALHLQGYDHETVRDATIMEAREKALLAELGFPDPYSSIK